MKILAIIPARGGSKRIPNKNTKKFLGKPLIAWAIESAKKSKLIDKILVTTDNEKIASISRSYGAETPFIRPSHLANDTVGIEPVLLHALEWLKKNEDYSPDAIILLQTTNPLRLTRHIDEAIRLFRDTDYDSLVSVTEVVANNNPFWLLKDEGGGKVKLLTGDSLKDIKTRSQDLPKCYSRNDILYIFKPKNLYEKKPNLYGDKVKLFIMDEIYHTDINTPEDWEITKGKIKRLRELKHL